MYMIKNNGKRVWYLHPDDEGNIMFIMKRPTDWYARNSILSGAYASYLIGKGGWDLRLL